MASPQLSTLCHREAFQTQCGLSALLCLPQQEMAVVKLGPPKPVLPRVVDFCSPQYVFGGQTIKLTCHLALKFDLRTYLQMMTLCAHTCTMYTHTQAHAHSTRTRRNWPVNVLWDVRGIFSGAFCPEQALPVSLQEDNEGMRQPLVYALATVCVFCLLVLLFNSHWQMWRQI